MAAVVTKCLLQCCSCGQDLCLNSHTLACLHNLCHICMEENTLVDRGESNVRKCPYCGEVFSVKTSNLLPFLATDIKLHLKQRCYSCSETGVVSVGQYWCQECEQLLCNNCNSYHGRFAKTHSCKNLDRVDCAEWIELVMSEKCFLHGKQRDLFCGQCNMCFCGMCYNGECHLRFECVSTHGLIVEDEVSRRKSDEGPILEKEVKEFAKSLKKSNEKLIRHSGELDTELDRKCLEIWQNYEEQMECAQHDAHELCDKLREEKCDEERRLQDQLAENETLLRQVEMWLLNCQHLLHETERNVDILCGLQTLRWKVQFWYKEWNRPEKQIEFAPNFSNFSLETINPLPILQLKKLKMLQEWNFQKGKPRVIKSIHVAEEDGHVFLCDCRNNSLIEFNQFGEFVYEFCIMGKGFRYSDSGISPYDMCSISPNILVCCGALWLEAIWSANVLLFLERIKIKPFLKIKTRIANQRNSYLSVCIKNDSIFVLDSDFIISTFTKEGEEIERIKIDGMSESKGSWDDFRIRVDPSSGMFWGSRFDLLSSSSEIVSFNSKGEKLSVVKEDRKDPFDFGLNQFGHFYFSSNEGIFSLLPKEKIFKFYKNSEMKPNICISENKMFIVVKNDEIFSIKIFQIFD